MAGLALADGVESANTVGFTTRTAGADEFIIIGSQFEDVSSTASNAVDASINDLVSGTYTPVAYDRKGNFRSTAPIIKAWVYDTANSAWKYTAYYYLSDAYVAADRISTLGWADGAGTYVTDTLDNGSAVWFKSSSACSVSFRGNVPGAAVSLEADNGEFVLICNPMPKAFTLNDSGITWSGLVPVAYDRKGNFRSTAPIIKNWVYDTENSAWKYTAYYYLSDAYVAADRTSTLGWADGAGTYVTDTIPEGYGFWFKPTSDATVTFASPIAAND